jgi:hypothetical protein
MARAISLHVGLNVISSAGPTGIPLEGCLNDALAMESLPQLVDFDRRDILLDGQATIGAVTETISRAAADLQSGGIFVFTFAGHGSFIGDEDLDEPDRRDETLVLSDFMLSDDVLGRALWPMFRPDTRVLMIADSCSSGTVFTVPNGSLELTRTRNKPFSLSSRRLLADNDPFIGTSSRRIRTISEGPRLRHLMLNKAFYDQVNDGLPANPIINASVILLAACQDDESTPDGNPHGAFTQALLDVLGAPNPPLNYDNLIGGIAAKLTAAGLSQTPFLSVAGQPDAMFRGQKPFTI